MHIEIVAEGLRFPEGPIWMKDGSIILCEIESGRIVRVRADGAKEVVAVTGGGPNGAAIGPDGALYVCNNGGIKFFEHDGLMMSLAETSDDYNGGSIDRVDLITGKVDRLYESCDGRRLSAPNDIVFDKDGGFWFSDLGKHFEHHTDYGALCYAKADGSMIKRVVPRIHPNGVGLSPDGKTLYAALTYEHIVLGFDIVGPGELKEGNILPGWLAGSLPNRRMPDSLAVTQDGRICVGVVLSEPGVDMVDPATGEVIHYDFPDLATTNICFGGADMQDAWVTLSTSGRLAKVRWDRPGLPLAFTA